jgi:hypothetical protein
MINPLLGTQLVDAHLISREASDLRVGHRTGALLLGAVLDPGADVDQREWRAVGHIHGGDADRPA